MTDDDAYREIAALRARLAAIERAAGMIEAPRTYTSRELSDRDTYTRNREDIHAALREPGTPRIVEGEPIERPAPDWPAPLAPGLTARGVDVFEADPPTPRPKGPR